MIAAVVMLLSIETGFGSLWVGYSSMIVAFSLIFVAVKNLRDKFNDGHISFGKALKTGLLIVLIGSTIYVLAWMVDYYCFHPDYMQKYTDSVISHAKASGASIADINKQKAQLASYAEMYNNPFMLAMLTYREILPVGIVMALGAALILKRKPENGQAAAVA